MAQSIEQVIGTAEEAIAEIDELLRSVSIARRTAPAACSKVLAELRSWENDSSWRGKAARYTAACLNERISALHGYRVAEVAA